MSSFLRRAVINFLYYHKKIKMDEAVKKYDDNRKSIEDVCLLIGEDVFLEILKFIKSEKEPKV